MDGERHDDNDDGVMEDSDLDAMDPLPEVPKEAQEKVAEPLPRLPKLTHFSSSDHLQRSSSSSSSLALVSPRSSLSLAPETLDFHEEPKPVPVLVNTQEPLADPVTAFLEENKKTDNITNTKTNTNALPEHPRRSMGSEEVRRAQLNFDLDPSILRALDLPTGLELPYTDIPLMTDPDPLPTPPSSQSQPQSQPHSHPESSQAQQSSESHSHSSSVDVVSQDPAPFTTAPPPVLYKNIPLPAGHTGSPTAPTASCCVIS